MQKFYPRIRTSLLPADGGLDIKTQVIRTGVMLPTQKEPVPKLYINSVLRDKGNPGVPDESLSIRLAEEIKIKSFFVGIVLAIRERNKFVPGNEIITKEDLIRRIETSWRGSFDAQVHVYGFKR